MPLIIITALGKSFAQEVRNDKYLLGVNVNWLSLSSNVVMVFGLWSRNYFYGTIPGIES